jgi:predicted glycosyltransferase
MAAEAAVLGTPSLRFNDFVGEIGYLEELEHRYELTRGIRTDAPEALFEQVRQWLAMPDLRATGRQRAARMLEEKIDVAAFMTSFIERYPNGATPTRPAGQSVPEAMA